MDSDELKARTKKFALRILKLVDALPKTISARTIGSQLCDAGTSVAANYRSACKARSKADFISKITVVEEEADESVFWLEIIIESGMLSENRVRELLKEAKELTAIFTSSGKTSKERYGKTTKEKSIKK